MQYEKGEGLRIVKNGRSAMIVAQKARSVKDARLWTDTITSDRTKDKMT